MIAAGPDAASIAKSASGRAGRVFFPGIAALIVVTVFLGFARTFFLAPVYHNALPNLLVAVHGVVFLAWIALFAVQATLVAAGRRSLHMRLGTAGAFMLGLVVLMGCLIMLEGLRRDVSRPGIDQICIFSLNLVGFSIAVALLWRGLVLRTDPASHKRMMLLGTVPLLGPAVVRWPFAFVALNPPVVGLVLDGFLLLTLAFDLSTLRRVHRATLWGGAGIVLAAPLALSLAATPAWRWFVAWLQHALIVL